MTAFILLLFAVSSLLTFIKYYLGQGSNIVHILLNFFYLDNENNIPTYFSSISLLGAALLLFYISAAKFRTGNTFKFYWLMLGAIFVLLSMDEFMSVHELMIEPMQEIFEPTGFLYFAWVIPGTLFVGALGLLFIRFVIKLKSRFRRKFIYSGLLYLSGALGMEMVGGYIGYTYGSENFLYAMVANTEEVLEMLGITFFIYSLLLYARDELIFDIVVRVKEPKAASSPTRPLLLADREPATSSTHKAQNPVKEKYRSRY